MEKKNHRRSEPARDSGSKPPSFAPEISLKRKIIVPALSLLLIILALMISDYSAKNNASESAYSALIASAGEQVDTLKAVWQGQIDTLNTVAIDLSEQREIDMQGVLARLSQLEKGTSYSHVAYADADGLCHCSDGSVYDVSSREYFRRALSGSWSVEKITDSKCGDSVLIVLAVPIEKEHQVTGVVLGGYTEELLDELIVPEIYDGQAYSLICRDNGEVVIDTDNPNSRLDGDNIFEFLRSADFDGGISVEGIRSRLAVGEIGAVSYRMFGEDRYAVYIPLDTYAAAGEQLAMFNIVPGSLVNAAARRQATVNALLFALILLASMISLGFFVHVEKQNVRSAKEERDRLAVIEEQNRIAMAESGLNIARYELKTKYYFNHSQLLTEQGFGQRIENVPDTFIEAGLVADECIDDYRAFFDKLQRGESAETITAMKATDGGFRWYEAKATIVNDSAGLPIQAIITFRDVTDQREKEVVYTNWRQYIQRKEPDAYTLFRCNLSKSSSFDSMEGSLLKIHFNPELTTFNERTLEYAGRFVHLDDFDAYVELINSENLLASYYRGVNKVSMDYRERTGEDEYRWLRVTVKMIPYSDNKDIEVFLMYEDVGDELEAELTERERVNTDSLTGVLTRAAFIARLEELFSNEQSDAKHAMILVDIDGFRRLNDSFGRLAGDQALVDIAKSLRSLVREDDLLGRLGGDEFLICLKNVPNKAVAEQKAMQIQALMRMAFSVDIKISASLGIALYPTDGRDFNALYHSVDLALNSAKANGEDSLAFFSGEAAKPAKVESRTDKAKTHKKKLLVVDDNDQTVKKLMELFDEQYDILSCENEKDAMISLRRYGISIAAVFLSVSLRGGDSLGLIDRVLASDGISAVPIIAMGGSDQRDICDKAILHGAADIITEPFGSELLRIRLESAVSKAENERLRAQNTYLQTQNADGSRLRTVFENTGTVVVDYDWHAHSFSYSPDISRHIMGSFDDRSLWQIFMSDMVADARDVKSIQQLIYDLANDRDRTTASIDIMLKTPAKVKHWFTVTAFKRVNDMNMTHKIILTFLDVNEDILASKKLIYQAEHDSLTGLFNRSAFLSFAKSTVSDQPADAFMLLCCDIDNFRFINERFGRVAGDKLLQYSAEKLQVYAEAMDGFAGRLSNDVFAILLPNNPGIYERIDSLIPDFFKDYPLTVNITCRAGAYIITDPKMTVDSMLDCAAVAKEHIKGKYTQRLALFAESMNSQTIIEQDITDRMETALAEGQFDVYIQPQFNHATGQIVGAEALVRWIDPKNGVISPGVFIPVFEKNGFITKLDEYVWERTADYMSQWMDRGNEPVPISVNVSREDTKDPQLCEKLLNIVQKYNIPTHLFRLEITESLFAEDTRRLIEVVEKLHECGFLVEMDDFGSGYSSLNILKDVPVDILKLDMRFFSGSDNLGRGGMIVTAVMRMSRWLNIPVVAEGVEHDAQANFLLGVGCPTIQGYLYEKPMPAHSFEEKFLTGRSMSGIPENNIDSKLANTEFWDPHSADSLVFDSFIGPAVIFEYHNGQYEVIRMNRRFIAAAGIHEAVMLPAMGLVNFADEDRPKLKKAVLELIYSGGEVKSEMRMDLVDGTKPSFRVTMRLIAKSSDRAMIFAELDG